MTVTQSCDTIVANIVEAVSTCRYEQFPALLSELFHHRYCLGQERFDEMYRILLDIKP